MIIDYHHTQITAPKGSEAEVRRFYGGVLGLREIPVNVRAAHELPKPARDDG